MFDLTNGWQAAGAAAGLVLLLGVGTLLFQAGCALADVIAPGFPRALLVFGVAAAVCLPLAGLLFWLAGPYESDPSAFLGPVRAVALGVGLLATWVLSAL